MNQVQRALSDEDFIVIRRINPGPHSFLIAEFYDDHTGKVEWMVRGPQAGPEDWFLWAIRATAVHHKLMLFNLDLQMLMAGNGRVRRMTPAEKARFLTLEHGTGINDEVGRAGA